LNSKNFKKQLNKVKKLEFLIVYITKFEDLTLSAPNAYKFIIKSRNNINDKRILLKLNTFLRKNNPNLSQLLIDIKINNYLLYTPLVSVDIERSGIL